MNTTNLLDKLPFASGEDGEEFTLEQLNNQQLSFLSELEDLGLNIATLRRYLEENTKHTLRDIYSQKDVSLELRDRALARKIAVLHQECLRLKAVQEGTDNSEESAVFIKKVTQVGVILVNSAKGGLKKDDELKLLAIIEKYSPDVEGLDVDDKEAVEIFRRQLNETGMAAVRAFYKKSIFKR